MNVTEEQVRAWARENGLYLDDNMQVPGWMYAECASGAETAGASPSS